MSGDGALALAARIARGELSARQALQQSLDAVARLNPALNAVCNLDADVGQRHSAAVDAELGACRGDAERRALHARKPFLGVPSLLKDLGMGATDLATTLGSRYAVRRGGFKAAVDATLVARYRDAGFVLFGRSTSPEMGISPSTEAAAYGGPTRNPAGTGCSAGGSSGGAGAAVASGMVAIAHASDGAGSIRIPASCNGLVGLKPSRGLMPFGPHIGEGWGGLGTEHVLATNVRDCAAALLCTAGADAGAPYPAPRLAPELMAQLDRAADAPRLRIALCDTFFEGDAVHAEVAAAVRAVATRLQKLGHAVEPARPPLATLELIRPLAQVVACGMSLSFNRVFAAHGAPSDGDLEPTTQGALELSRRISGAEYMECLTQLHVIARRLVGFFERFDLLLTPVLAEPPAPLGRWTMHNPDFLDYRIGAEGLWRYSPFCPLANATGGASIALPAGRSAEGLPIGAMLTGQIGDDARLLHLAAELEEDARA